MNRPGAFPFLRVSCKEVRDYSPQKNMATMLVSEVVRCRVPISSKRSVEEAGFPRQTSFILRRSCSETVTSAPLVWRVWLPTRENSVV